MTGVRFPTMASSADGWRGRLNQGFSPENVDALARSILRTLRPKEGGRFLVSHDSRAGGTEAAAIVIQTIQRSTPSPQILYLPHLPTPIASALLANGEADFAILVTASHNPADWNGLKVKLKPGVPLTGEDERRINDAYQRLAAGDTTKRWSETACSIPEKDAGNTRRVIGDYMRRLLGRMQVDGQTSSALKVVVDGLNGIAGGAIASLCRAMGHRVISLGEAPRDDFGGLKPDPTIASSIARCVQAVRDETADLGFVLDGDGDRIIVLDHQGTGVQSQELMSALLQYAPPALRTLMSGDVLVTTTCGQMIRAVASSQGSKLVEGPVGFKHISRHLCASACSVGVGSVGDLGFASFTTDRDPMAVVVLTSLVLAHTRKPLAELIDQLRTLHKLDHLQWTERHLQSSHVGDVRTLAEHMASTAGWEGFAVETTVDGLRIRCRDSQWLMVRQSTTEGGCRVYGELDRASLGRLLAETDASAVG